jgi:hypothetical protein
MICCLDFLKLWYDLFSMEKRNKLNIKNNPIVIGVLVVAGIGLMFFLATNVVPKALVTLTQASSSGRVVVSGSYLLGERILAKADGKDVNKVNVFLLDKNGKPVQGQTVELTGMNTGINQVNSVSDATGKIVFELTSTKEGQFRMNALYGGSELPQTIVVTFRN